MHIWAVANQKGGVGKTTSVVTLSGLLADAGHRVLMVDLDPHGSLTSYFRFDPDSIEHSAYDLFLGNGKIQESLPKELILETGHPNLSLLPSSTALATLERHAQAQGGMGLVISKTLAILWDDYDYVLIDSPPVLGVLMINALAACQQLIIPVQTEFLAIKGLERMVRTLTMINRARKRPVPYLIVPTLFDRRTQASNKSLRSLKEAYDEAVWHSVIPIDTKLRDASTAGIAPSALDNNARGVKAYTSLVTTLLEPMS
ncbi:MAG: ParA family protein [Marinomonas sp.]|uniref:ParA family protein n=1 Tax=unclassified Marinomonas TaxID=196814 RepID=UPI0005FA0B79|nr:MULTISPECIES: ParA family protein [unclassified Marinomonas]KJZ16348.1 cobalamin biosynthesis protein CobQ [Marinomonas sp. S3726]KZM40032.1 cobalamin biosynthesis protein CobQ [Marinomonas sp. SBI22]KZM41326.1 cobalamin biosynthesis protein CobQ [Marinomonas sp. SBI8L]